MRQQLDSSQAFSSSFLPAVVDAAQVPAPAAGSVTLQGCRGVTTIPLPQRRVVASNCHAPGIKLSRSNAITSCGKSAIARAVGRTGQEAISGPLAALGTIIGGGARCGKPTASKLVRVIRV